MTKRKKLSYKKILKSDWCPLFGVLPDIPESHGGYEYAKRCISLIKRAREDWGVDHHDIFDSAFPSVADLSGSPYRGYVKERVPAVRSLFLCLDEIAWKTGPSGRNKINGRGLRTMVETLCDVRQVVREHLIREVNKVWCRYFPDGLNPKDPSSLRQIYLLFAIHESWHILKWLRFEMNGDLYLHIIKRTHYAEGLLAIADHYARLEEKEDLELRVWKQEDDEGKRKKGLEEWIRITELRDTIIRKMATDRRDEARAKNKKAAVYKELAQGIYDHIITPSFRKFIRSEYPADATELIKSFQRKRIKSLSSIAHIIAPTSKS